MDDEQIDFVILAVPVALAVVTAVVLDAGISVVGVWLFLDLATVWLLYGGVAMVTKPEETVQARGNLFLPGPVGWIDDRFGADSRVSLPGMPSIYPKNLRFAVPVSILMSIVVLGVGTGVATDGGLGRRSGGTVSELLGALAVLERPAVAVVGAAVVLAQVARFYRSHVATGRHERLTAYMVLDMQVTYMLLYAFGLFPFAVFVFVTGLVADSLVASAIGELTALLLWVVVAAVTGGAAKLVLERSRVRGERRPGLDGEESTARLSPTPPPEGDSGDGSTPQPSRSNGQ
ncbi:hypothetical protein [Halobaculum sp. MBLA0143]|uniref:hypothetical protein n=1 Tax=Halobaculum sp. MBLA0143 TaxID=3079933 RepID=UPI0035261ED2